MGGLHQYLDIFFLCYHLGVHIFGANIDNPKIIPYVLDLFLQSSKVSFDSQAEGQRFPIWMFFCHHVALEPIFGGYVQLSY